MARQTWYPEDRRRSSVGVGGAREAEGGETTEAMNAAAQIGDDTLQRNAGRTVQPHTFTHGTSE